MSFAMIRPLDPLDFFRCAFFSNSEKSNHAHTLANLGNEQAFGFSLIEASRAGLLLRGKGCAWVWSNGNKVAGLVAARHRSGPKSWEITQLFLGADEEGKLLDLLDKVSQTAASNGGERVFLRLLRDDPLVDVARRGGFFPSVLETLYRGLPQSSPGKTDDHEAPSNVPSSLREKAQSDDYDLFRLYNIATPSEVRQVAGMTFDQWSASREPARGRCQEFVLSRDGSATGWLRAFQRSGVGHLETMVNPKEERSLESIVDFGLRQLEGTRSVYCLAPEYQIAFQSILAQKGFQAVSDYITLVKSNATRAKEAARARATIAPMC